MMGFISDELVRAVVKEREEDARKVRPHTDCEPEERQSYEHDDHHAHGTWLAPYLRAGSASAR